jgi:hypothetical protein
VVSALNADATGPNFTAIGLPVTASDGPMIGAILPVLKARILIAMKQKQRNTN